MHLNVNSVLDNPVASMMVLCEQLGVPMGRWVGQGRQLTFSPEYDWLVVSSHFKKG